MKLLGRISWPQVGGPSDLTEAPLVAEAPPPLQAEALLLTLGEPVVSLLRWHPGSVVDGRTRFKLRRGKAEKPLLPVIEVQNTRRWSSEAHGPRSPPRCLGAERLACFPEGALTARGLAASGRARCKTGAEGCFCCLPFLVKAAVLFGCLAVSEDSYWWRSLVEAQCHGAPLGDL